jgi:predicted TIM-barrel fold metal-dependent hydrolase
VENIAVEAGPAPWITVLKNFPGLRICIAHLGGETGSADSRLLFNELVTNLNYKVYTDISCVLISGEQYKSFRNFLSTLSADAAAKSESRLLFGSDFPMSLLFGADSYLDYLMNYERNMDDAEIMRYSNSNSARFVFGEEKSV